jgi:Uma2 family endonuclease
MPVLVTDPDIEERLMAEREAIGGNQHDEVWDGVYVMSPLPNIEHQILAAELWLIFRTILAGGGLGIAINGVNVSDRDDGWQENYREPDVAVFLAGNPARNCGTHWHGGPDFAVEILSRGDLAREKFPFYAKIGVRELLLVDRDPWALELYRLQEGRLTEAGRLTPGDATALTSEVLPLAFRLLPGEPRPAIEAIETAGPGHWTV